MQSPNIDLMRHQRVPATGPTEFYLRPHFYAMPVNVARIRLSPDGRRMPAVTLSVLASLANTGVVCIGDSAVTVGSGFQLDAGKGITFSTSGYQYIGGMAGNLRLPQLGQNYFRILLDIADFFVIATAESQTIRIFWSESVKVP